MKNKSMERFTEPGVVYDDVDFADGGIYAAMNQLRAYEDTGLTPEQVVELQEENARLKSAKDCDT